MKRVSFFIILIFMQGMLAGCLFGDRRALARTVSFDFEEGYQANQTLLSISDPTVQDTITRIDAVLSKEHFVREFDRDMTSYPGYLTSYAHYEKPPLRTGIVPELFFRSNRLEVVTVEIGNHTTRPNQITTRLCAALQEVAPDTSK